MSLYDAECKELTADDARAVAAALCAAADVLDGLVARMNTNHDNATTWRDLADELTAEQVKKRETAQGKFTASGIIGHPKARASLMGFARQ